MLQSCSWDAPKVLLGKKSLSWLTPGRPGLLLGCSCAAAGSSWAVSGAPGMLQSCSWDAPGLLLLGNSSLFWLTPGRPGLLLGCFWGSWNAPKLLLGSSWATTCFSDCFLGLLACSLAAPGQLLDFCWSAPGCLMHCCWPVPDWASIASGVPCKHASAGLLQLDLRFLMAKFWAPWTSPELLLVCSRHPRGKTVGEGFAERN